MIDRRSFCRLALIVAVGFASALLPSIARAEGKARNVILFIGDGMGFEQLKAASLYAHGEPGKLVMQNLPRAGEVETRSASDEVTDSAAAATAYATGKRVKNGVIAMAIPGTGEPLPTILEQAAERGLWTGVVSTDTVVGATPGSFIAHVVSRKLQPQIAEQILTKTRPNVLMGGGMVRLDPPALTAAGYTVVPDVAGVRKLAEGDILASEQEPRVAALFGLDRFPYRHHDIGEAQTKRNYGRAYPELHEMTAAALNILKRAEKGFFLTIEAGLVDKSGHAINTKNDPDRISCNIKETLSMDRAIETAVDWARDRGDTLIIITADHETGGLEIGESAGKGKLPEFSWAHRGHTAVNVPVYGFGPGSEKIEPVMPNTRIHTIMLEALGWD